MNNINPLKEFNKIFKEENKLERFLTYLFSVNNEIPSSKEIIEGKNYKDVIELFNCTIEKDKENIIRIYFSKHDGAENHNDLYKRFNSIIESYSFDKEFKIEIDIGTLGVKESNEDDSIVVVELLAKLSKYNKFQIIDRKNIFTSGDGESQYLASGNTPTRIRLSGSLRKKAKYSTES